MDSGYLKSGDTLENYYDVQRQLSPEDTIGIVDGLLSSEVRPLVLVWILLEPNAL